VSSGGFVPKTKATLGYDFKTEPSCIHYKHSKVLLFMEENERKEHQFNITEITYASPKRDSFIPKQIMLILHLEK
jgi:hypothetical protein